ncbi:MAG TPA: alpha/beta hydrolase [Rhodocyclaceae bacterium]|nr:alpha/beta hydrolase [Rhodocyclaceae bacterium]
MQTLFLLSGLLCNEDVWQYQTQELQKQYDVRVVSFQGFDSIPAMASHVLAQAPETFSLAGHSMGGRVAIEAYRQAPERIRRLALLDTGYEAAAPHEYEKRMTLVNKALAEGIGSIAETWAKPMIGVSNRSDETLIQRMLDMVGTMSGEIYAGQTRALLGRPDGTDVLPTIACPTLVLCGKEDTWSPPERHKQMASLITDSHLTLVDSCGHMCMMERPAQILDALSEWMTL